MVFDDVEAAERALKEVQGFELFDKPMILDFAKTRSDATVQREGNPEELEAHKRRRLAEKGRIYGFWKASKRDNLTSIVPCREEASQRSFGGSKEAQA